ncbi:MAG: COR domain-containing protein [Cyanobacteria bacterium P01_C01_bin.147]
MSEQAYAAAEKKIAEALQTGATELDLSCEWNADDSVKLSELPDSLGQLTQLRSLNLSENQLTALPESLGQLTQLRSLNLSYNQLTALPESMGQLTQLQELDLYGNQLTTLPESLGQLFQLQTLNLGGNQLTVFPGFTTLLNLRKLILSGNQFQAFPDTLQAITSLESIHLINTGLRKVPQWIRNFTHLRVLDVPENEIPELPDIFDNLSHLERVYLRENRLSDIPTSLGRVQNLERLELGKNPLNPELAAAYKQGFDAVKAYLRAKAEAQIVLNEAKLILIGEGEVGKSCLLDALQDEPWKKHESTHGIEIKPVQVTYRNEDGSETEITLNTWDFGGQKVYRPTHQFFFSAPAVYLVVWKPREGSLQGAVEYWINTIKHRAGADAKVLIVGTHGGPQQRQPDIDLQDLRDKFGADCVLGAFHVNSQPTGYNEADEATWTGERTGIAALKAKIAEVAAALPNVGRSVATSWNNVLQAVKHRSETDPYLTYPQFEELCQQEKVEKVLAKTYAGMLNQLGYVIHYGDANDDLLQQIMILKPDWLAKAISFVLDDEMTRKRNGLVSHERLSQLWSHPPYDYEDGYPEDLHPLFLKLMERFDISYEVVVNPASHQPTANSLIAQLVKDQTPEELPEWDEYQQPGDQQKRQICQIVEKEKNQSANAEGLFYRLIARLHKYSLGRDDYDQSVHWQRGLLLDDDYNGRALLRHIGNDIHITVRAAYPQYLLYELTKDVKELVENPDQGWEGLRCDVMVPCIEPCGLKSPGRGLFDVDKLKESKRRGRPDYPCNMADCDEWQDIDCLLQNATVTRASKLSDSDIQQIRDIVDAKDKKDDQRFRALSSQADEQLAILMQIGLDEARQGPRLFSLTPANTKFLDNPAWATQKFKLTLWCEHSRKPLPALWDDSSRGVYKLEKSREWLENYGPALRTVTKTLSAILPVVAATTKVAMPGDTYKGIENELNFGKELFGAGLKSSGALANVGGDDLIADPEHGVARQAQNALLRELHAFLQQHDPSFGGLVRVQNKRREFIWVHPQFADEY